LAELTPLQIVLCAIALVGQYIWKLLWPVKLCVFWIFHPSTSLFDLHVLAGLLVLLAFGGGFLVCWRSREPSVRFASFAILWFFATLAPALDAHWVGENVFTERYLYLPSVGAAWLAGLGASKLWRRAAPHAAQRWALALAGLAACGLFATRVVTRNRDWNNDIVLYTRTLDLSPDAGQIQSLLAAAYWREGAMDKAEMMWRGMLAKHPNSIDVVNNLGLVASRRHQYGEAVEFFQRAIKLKPDLLDPHLNLGDTYLKMGLTEPAELQLREAATLSRFDTRAYNELGKLFVAQGRMEEAQDQFRTSLRIAPNAVAYDYLGMLDIRRHAMEDAEHDFRAALGSDESDSNAHFGLGYVYKAAGRKTEALSQYQAGLVEDPTNAQALAAVQELRQGNTSAAP
jgi:Tfp pilus assembly protein PilF